MEIIYNADCESTTITGYWRTLQEGRSKKRFNSFEMEFSMLKVVV